MEEFFLGLIENSIKQHWDLPAFTDYKGDSFLYKDVADRIARLHFFFENTGIKKGDKVALIGRNSSAWAINLFGILSYGAVAVPILQNFKSDNVHHIVNHSDSKVLIAANSAWENLSAAEMPNLHYSLQMKKLSLWQSKHKTPYRIEKKFNSLFEKKYPTGVHKEDVQFHKENPDELAILNYTSGTSGFSKGVMISFHSLWSNTKFAQDNLDFIKAGDKVVCILPMAHMYGLAFEILNSVNIGCHVHFLTRTPSPNIIAKAFDTIKPVLILSVPLIIEKIVRKKIFPLLEKPHMRILTRIPFLKDKIKETIAKKLNDFFGGQFYEVVIGGAAINQEVEQFLRSINFRYTIGYGMTECSPLIAYEQWDTFRLGSVGRVVDRMQVKIDSTDPENVVGEIMVNGDNVMMGYYKNEEATQQVLSKEGWLRTGDLGTIDKDGFIYIKGRSKNMILSASGQNIYPEEIEDKLNNMPFIDESVVISIGEKIVALIHPDWEQVDSENLKHEEIEKLMQANIKELNNAIPSYSTVSSFKIYTEEFEKTPKRSIKRYLYQP
ncbi:MAG: AMP-binding protein [Massilibacteroides sp.]|nr:AMP-binding protein [Massilibacteroides sp.]